MVTPLLNTKLFIPPRRARASVVDRSRLIERLNAALESRLILISAPAGFGKTTLLSEWIPQSERRVAWLSLDESDNDPIRFWMYFVAALETLKTDLGIGALSVLQAPQPPPIEVFLTTLLNDIAAIPDSLVLVLDDYHIIESTAVQTGLTFLIDHLPPNMQLLLTSRVDPPLPLARWRVRNQLAEVRIDDLRFTPAEAAVFLNHTMGLSLAAEDIAALEECTEGWIAGLQLAALSMQGRSDLAGFIAAFTGSHHFIVDYLSAEALRRQSTEVQSFLLQTSILDRLCGPLCEAVTQQAGGQATLEQLEQTNVFTTRLDDERQWFCYHQLFADVLRHEAQQSIGTAEVARLHQRASKWYEQHAFASEAIQHALIAGDHDRAARLIVQNVYAALERGEVSTLRRWLSALPDEMVRAQPSLSVAQAWAIALSGQVAASEPYVQAAEQALASTSDPEAVELQGQIAALRAQLAFNQNDLQRAVELCQQALHYLPEENVFVRGAIILGLGNMYRMGSQTQAAGDAYAQAYTMGRTIGHTMLMLFGLVNAAELHDVQGHLHQAARDYQQAIELATDRDGRPLPIASAAQIGLGKIHREWNQLDRALSYLNAGLELGQRSGMEGLEIDYAITLALVKQASEDEAGAREALQRAAHVAQRHGNHAVIVRVATFEARLGLWQGHPEIATRWAETYNMRAEDELSDWLEIEHTTLARLLIAQGQTAEALRLLGRLLDATEAAGRTGRMIEVLALQALAFQAQADSSQAHAALERALSLAEPEGYVRIFVDEGEAMRFLILDCGLWIEKQGRREDRKLLGYVDKLLAAFKQPAVLQSELRNQKSEMLDPLSPRELEVLRLMAAGKKNQEIADELFVVVGTVKAHINAIYRKLDVNTRVQAVTKAKELALI